MENGRSSTGISHDTKDDSSRSSKVSSSDGQSSIGTKLSADESTPVITKIKGKLYYKRKRALSKWKEYFAFMDELKMQINFYKTESAQSGKLGSCKLSVDVRFIEKITPLKGGLFKKHSAFKICRRAGLSPVQLAAENEEERARWISTLEDIIVKRTSGIIAGNTDTLKSHVSHKSNQSMRSEEDSDSEKAILSVNDASQVKPRKVSGLGFSLDKSLISSVRLRRTSSESPKKSSKRGSKTDVCENDKDEVCGDKRRSAFGVKLKKVDQDEIKKAKEPIDENSELQLKYNSLSKRSPKIPLSDHVKANIDKETIAKISPQSQHFAKNQENRSPNRAEAKSHKSCYIPLSNTLKSVIKNSKSSENIPEEVSGGGSPKIHIPDDLLCHAVTAELPKFESELKEFNEKIDREAITKVETREKKDNRKYSASSSIIETQGGNEFSHIDCRLENQYDNSQKHNRYSENNFSKYEPFDPSKNIISSIQVKLSRPDGPKKPPRSYSFEIKKDLYQSKVKELKKFYSFSGCTDVNRSNSGDIKLLELSKKVCSALDKDNLRSDSITEEVEESDKHESEYKDELRIVEKNDMNEDNQKNYYQENEINKLEESMSSKEEKIVYIKDVKAESIEVNEESIKHQILSDINKDTETEYKDVMTEGIEVHEKNLKHQEHLDICKDIETEKNEEFDKTMTEKNQENLDESSNENINIEDNKANDIEINIICASPTVDDKFSNEYVDEVDAYCTNIALATLDEAIAEVECVSQNDSESSSTTDGSKNNFSEERNLILERPIDNFDTFYNSSKCLNKNNQLDKEEDIYEESKYVPSSSDQNINAENIENSDPMQSPVRIRKTHLHSTRLLQEENTDEKRPSALSVLSSESDDPLPKFCFTGKGDRSSLSSLLFKEPSLSIEESESRKTIGAIDLTKPLFNRTEIFKDTSESKITSKKIYERQDKSEIDNTIIQNDEEESLDKVVISTEINKEGKIEVLEKIREVETENTAKDEYCKDITEKPECHETLVECTTEIRKNSSSSIDSSDDEESEEEGDFFPTGESVDKRYNKLFVDNKEAIRTSGIIGLKEYLEENEQEDVLEHSGVNRIGSSVAVEKLRQEIDRSSLQVTEL